jgi:hypothetical protein
LKTDSLTGPMLVGGMEKMTARFLRRSYSTLEISVLLIHYFRPAVTRKSIECNTKLGLSKKKIVCQAFRIFQMIAKN